MDGTGILGAVFVPADDPASSLLINTAVTVQYFYNKLQIYPTVLSQFKKIYFNRLAFFK